MDYKSEYLKLKQRLMDESQRSGKMNPQFVDELSNLSFVVGKNVLGDDVRAVIFSLVKEFNEIASINITHNIELSQYYAVGKGLLGKKRTAQCENCEIVLKYVDTTICMAEGRERKYIIEENKKYFQVDENKEKTEIDCTISRGLVRFYIKQKEGDTFKYTRIRVVKIIQGNTLQPFMNSLYLDNDEITKMENETNVAICKAQSEQILSDVSQNKMESSNKTEIMKTIGSVDNIVGRTKTAATVAQITKMSSQKIIVLVPSKSAVKSANAVAKYGMGTQTAKNRDLTAIIVPGNDAIPLQSDPATTNVNAMIGVGGTCENVSPGDTLSRRLLRSGSVVSENELYGGRVNKLNTSQIIKRASIPVDANLLFIPAKNVVDDESIKVTQTKQPYAILNNLAALAEKVKTGVSNLFKSDESKKGATVQPVSSDMSVMTPGPYNENVPPPKSSEVNEIIESKSTTISQTSVQKNIAKKLSNQATKIIKKGDLTTLKRGEDEAEPLSRGQDKACLLSEQADQREKSLIEKVMKKLADKKRTTVEIQTPSKYENLSNEIDLSDVGLSTENEITGTNTAQLTIAPKRNTKTIKMRNDFYL